MKEKKKRLTKKFFEEAGRKGGEITKKRGKEYYSKIAKKRWEEHNKNKKDQ